MKASSNQEFVCGAFFGFLLGVVIWLAMVRPSANWLWQLEAVNAGHAEFFLDADHERQWRWCATQPSVEAKPLVAVERKRRR